MARSNTSRPFPAPPGADQGGHSPGPPDTRKTGLDGHSLDLRSERDISATRELITRRWPESTFHDQSTDRLVFTSGIAPFDDLFPLGGLPYGQLVELTGKSGSGKTGLLFTLLAGMAARKKGLRIGYIDFPNTFFPVAADYQGLIPNHLFIVKPDVVGSGIRAAELLLKYREVAMIVFDLIGVKHELPLAMLHRIRQKTVRAKALIWFLTEQPEHDSPREIVPASMASLRLDVTRIAEQRVKLAVVKSRICKPGNEIEVVI